MLLMRECWCLVVFSGLGLTNERTNKKMRIQINTLVIDVDMLFLSGIIGIGSGQQWPVNLRCYSKTINWLIKFVCIIYNFPPTNQYLRKMIVRFFFKTRLFHINVNTKVFKSHINSFKTTWAILNYLKSKIN